jgi:hypothetical protein
VRRRALDVDEDEMFVGVIVFRRVAYVVAVVAALGVAACSGSMGGGSSLPAPQGYNPTPNSAAAAILREHTTAGAIYLAKDLTELDFPSSTGFGFAIDLGTPKPKTALTAGGSASKASSVTPAPSPSPAPSPTASATVKKSGATPSPEPSGPKIDTHVTIFPQDAPVAPTPAPTGDVQSFATRVAIMRGTMMSSIDLKICSLSCVRFKLPKDERPEGRDYTVAIFEQHKHRKFSLVAWDSDATLEGDTVTVEGATKEITLKKKQGYIFVLYGDDLEPTPVPKGYPAQGNNPFVTPQPGGRPGYPGQQQPGQPYYGPPTPYYGPPTPYYGPPTPAGAATYNPYAPH